MRTASVLLEELLRPPASPPLLTLLCFRSEETASKPFLQALLDRGGSDGCVTLSLGPMEDDGSAGADRIADSVASRAVEPCRAAQNRA